MSAESFQRASQSILNRLGADVRLGGRACKAFIAHNVEIAQGDMIVARSVATFLKTDIPRTGELLVVIGASDTDESYLLEAPLADNGYTVRFVLRRMQ